MSHLCCYNSVISLWWYKGISNSYSFTFFSFCNIFVACDVKITTYISDIPIVKKKQTVFCQATASHSNITNRTMSSVKNRAMQFWGFLHRKSDCIRNLRPPEAPIVGLLLVCKAQEANLQDRDKICTVYAKSEVWSVCQRLFSLTNISQRCWPLWYPCS